MQRNGAPAGTETSLGISGNLFNFKRADTAVAADYSTYPITAGTRSYTVWLRMKFTGTFNKVDNFQFWRSTDFSPSTGLFIRWKNGGLMSAGTYAAPITGTTQAVSAVPTSDPGTANIGVGTNPSGNLTASGYSNYIVLQLATSSTAAAGDTSLAVFTANYDEQ